MEEKKYLNEEKYQNAEKKIKILAVIVLVLGLSIGGFLIYKGVAKPGTAKVDELRVELENKKAELENSGVEFDEFAKYSDGDKYDLKVITKALDPSFSYCEFDEYKDSPLTKEYCSAKNGISDFSTTASIMFGAFICFATVMIAGSIFTIAKRRSILAFQAQQIMPIAKEGIDEMAPTVGNAAKEIAKGIKEGINEADKEDE